MQSLALTGTSGGTHAGGGLDMVAKLLFVVVQATDAQTLDTLIDQLARSACDVSNSTEDDAASIMIDESGYALVPHA